MIHVGDRLTTCGIEGESCTREAASDVSNGENSDMS